jgi:hypothetical protein
MAVAQHPRKRVRELPVRQGPRAAVFSNVQRRSEQTRLGEARAVRIATPSAALRVNGHVACTLNGDANSNTRLLFEKRRAR